MHQTRCDPPTPAIRERTLPTYRVLTGRPYPLGATWDGLGVNFAIYSENAAWVELCLYRSDDPTHEVARLRLREVTGHVFHGYVRDLRPGQLYGYRVHGDYEPQRGLRFNAAKLLVDPYARAISGDVDWSAPVFAYPLGGAEEDLAKDEQDSGWGMPKGVVTDSTFDWESDRPPRIPWHETIIYETHVRGLTMRHPDVPEELRGTYAGLATQPVIRHLKSLGITAVELMPVHAFVDEKHIVDRGLRNYWGYNTLNYFSPEPRYARSQTGGEVAEFKAMVRALHHAGVEVILDVVYNHTGEGNHMGPTLSLRGIDNPSYYRLVQDESRYYMDYTGTGNSLNTRHPQVLKLIMDSLRYWVLEMHVDGFRFDLASTLARELHDVDRLSAFFDTIHQDPVLSRVKLIAEPWDIGPGGYQVGNFPVLWAEWNGNYRDTVRAHWRGDTGVMGELGYRFTGSSDLYGDDGRRPYNSINFVTAHDGFTLVDLVSYEQKHNEANGEDNRDGHDHNLSRNYGVEGPSDDPEILAVRDRQRRNLLATVLLSQGVPMIYGGDEIGRTQQGNNNAYCQDNEISWYDWAIDERNLRFLEFTRRMIQLRKDHPALRRRKFFLGRAIRGLGVRDVVWFRPDGDEMSDEEWAAGWVKALGVRLDGHLVGEETEEGAPLLDDTLLILMNAHDEPVAFQLPCEPGAPEWELLLDTRDGEPPAKSGPRFPGGSSYFVEGLSLVIFRQPRSTPYPGR